MTKSLMILSTHLLVVNHLDMLWFQEHFRLPLETRFPELSEQQPLAELAGVHQTLRDLEFHPESHLEPFSDQPEAVRDLITGETTVD